MKFYKYLVAVTVVLVSVFFGACKDEDLAQDAGVVSLTQEQVQQGIIGLWRLNLHNDTEVLTNDRVFLKFNSDSTAIIYFCVGFDGKTNPAFVENHCTYSVVGTDVSLLMEDIPVLTLPIDNLSHNLLSATNVQSTLQHDMLIGSPRLEFTLAGNYGFDTAIVGMWQGESFTGDSTFGVANHRWEYLADGSYNYYTKIEQAWIPDPTSSNSYFHVVGDWMVSLWTNEPDDHIECWDLSILNNLMTWTARRDNQNPSLVSAAFTMTRVEPVEP
ncbi:MAG: hypothetical protein KBT04_02900 [Bacteroidales bacterium]|nr:hypothetical protein [Candidatus Colimorpha onthohippi]